MDLVRGCLPLCSGIMQSPAVLQRISFVFHPQEKVDDLKNAMKDLMVKKEDIQREIDHPQNRGKRPTEQLQLWLDKAEKTEDKLNQLLDDYSKGNCDSGSWFQNYCSRYKISSEAFKLKEEITQLTVKQPENKLTDKTPPKPVTESHTIVGKKIKSNVDIACSYLANETVGIIGIWGMGGVGKTTLLKTIRQTLSGDATMGFNHVLFIEASKDIQPEELRKKISESMQLQRDDKEGILNVLKTSNFVLLLDNIWEEVDLIDLGIPHPYSEDTSTKQYKHKVIFTTRSEDVCAKMGAVANTIKVECLKLDEAWDLFKDNAHLDVIQSDEKFEEIAQQVMERCDGLPLALKVVGKAMSNKKSVQDWEFILNSIKNSDTKEVQGMQESLFPILKLSYDTLPTNIQECFLCASILRQSLSKNDLLELWVGLGLIGDFVNLQQAYGKARHIMKNLEESCLLYSSSSDDDDHHVSLHDVIYEMAMWIASDYGRNRDKWIVKKYDSRWGAEIPTHDAEISRSANRVIISGEVELSPSLFHQCSDLSCLMIKSNSCFKNIPEGFFRQMLNLTYLNLQGTGIKKLPKDIKFLNNLQYLNISKTKISSLPKELVYLKKLQYLICRDLKGLGKVEEDLTLRLQKLKVIDIFPSGWVDLEQLKKLKKHVKAIGMQVVSKEVLQQLSCLPTTLLCLYNLDVISLSFDTLSCKNYGFLQELKIESCPQLKELVMNGSGSHLNTLKIVDVERLQKITCESPVGFFHVLKVLEISGCNLDNFAWVLRLPCLSTLCIKNCVEIETLFYIEEGEIQQQEVIKDLPALEWLAINNLPELVRISNFTLDFPRLGYLSVAQCLNLKKLPLYNNHGMIHIDCDREWWESLEWDDATIPNHLWPHFRQEPRVIYLPHFPSNVSVINFPSHILASFVPDKNPNEGTTSGSK